MRSTGPSFSRQLRYASGVGDNPPRCFIEGLLKLSRCRSCYPRAVRPSFVSADEAASAEAGVVEAFSAVWFPADAASDEDVLAVGSAPFPQADTIRRSADMAIRALTRFIFFCMEFQIPS